MGGQRQRWMQAAGKTIRPGRVAAHRSPSDHSSTLPLTDSSSRSLTSTRHFALTTPSRCAAGAPPEWTRVDVDVDGRLTCHP